MIVLAVLFILFCFHSSFLFAAELELTKVFRNIWSPPVSCGLEPYLRGPVLPRQVAALLGLGYVTLASCTPLLLNADSVASLGLHCQQVYTVGDRGMDILFWSSSRNEENKWMYANVVLSSNSPFRVAFEAEVWWSEPAEFALDDISFTPECIAGGTLLHLYIQYMFSFRKAEENCGISYLNVYHSYKFCNFLFLNYCNTAMLFLHSKKCRR